MRKLRYRKRVNVAKLEGRSLILFFAKAILANKNELKFEGYTCPRYLCMVPSSPANSLPTFASSSTADGRISTMFWSPKSREAPSVLLSRARWMRAWPRICGGRAICWRGWSLRRWSMCSSEFYILPSGRRRWLRDQGRDDNVEGRVKSSWSPSTPAS